MNVHRLSLMAATFAALVAYHAADATPARAHAAARVAERADSTVLAELVTSTRELLAQVAPEISLPMIEITVPSIKVD